jgi:hypothetical protein
MHLGREMKVVVFPNMSYFNFSEKQATEQKIFGEDSLMIIFI